MGMHAAIGKEKNCPKKWQQIDCACAPDKKMRTFPMWYNAVETYSVNIIAFAL